MVTITVRPILRYSPSSILCEKRPDRPSPKSLMPFSLAVLFALSSSKVGLAAVTILNVLAMPVTFFARSVSTHPSSRGRGMFRPRSWGIEPACGGWASCAALCVKHKQAPGPYPHDPSRCPTSAHHPRPLSFSAVPDNRRLSSSEALFSARNSPRANTTLASSPCPETQAGSCLTHSCVFRLM
jgi:hypothetical protein